MLYFIMNKTLQTLVNNKQKHFVIVNLNYSLKPSSKNIKITRDK